MGGADLWSLITVISNNERKLDDLYTVVEELPADQKAELVKRLLKSSDLNVTFGNNQLSGTIIVQINAMDQAALGTSCRRSLPVFPQRLHRQTDTQKIIHLLKTELTLIVE